MKNKRIKTIEHRLKKVELIIDNLNPITGQIVGKFRIFAFSRALECKKILESQLGLLKHKIISKDWGKFELDFYNKRIDEMFPYYGGNNSSQIIANELLTLTN